MAPSVPHPMKLTVCGRTLLFTRLGAEILAVEIADRVCQGSPHDCRERSALRGRPLQLAANDELRILGALPSRSGLKAAEVDGVEHFPRTRRVQQPYLKGSRAVDRACDRERRLQRHRIRNDVIAPAILRASDLGVGTRIEDLRMSGSRLEHDRGGDDDRNFACELSPPAASGPTACNACNCS